MARKKGEEEPCGNWMDTYGDMVTLLLTFFVMLFSMSSVNEEKWQQLVMAFTNNGKETQQVVVAPEGDGDEIGTNQSEHPLSADKDSFETQALPQDFDELYQYLKAYVESNNMEGSVSVSKAEGSVVIRFQDNILFGPDSPALRQSSYELLNFIGDGLKSVENQILTININGHTAAVPNNENYQVSDWKLSSERASNVAIFFDDKKKIDPQKILPIGYGKNFPIADNDTDEGRRKNRRVDMLIISNKGTTSSDEIFKSLLSGTFDPDKYPAPIGSSTDILRPDTSSSLTSDSDWEKERNAEEESSSGGASGAASSQAASLTPQSEIPEDMLPEPIIAEPVDPAKTPPPAAVAG